MVKMKRESMTTIYGLNDSEHNYLIIHTPKTRFKIIQRIRSSFVYQYECNLRVYLYADDERMVKDTFSATANANTRKEVVRNAIQVMRAKLEFDTHRVGGVDIRSSFVYAPIKDRESTLKFLRERSKGKFDPKSIFFTMGKKDFLDYKARLNLRLGFDQANKVVSIPNVLCEETTVPLGQMLRCYGLV